MRWGREQGAAVTATSRRAEEMVRLLVCDCEEVGVSESEAKVGCAQPPRGGGGAAARKRRVAWRRSWSERRAAEDLSTFFGFSFLLLGTRERGTCFEQQQIFCEHSH